VVVMDVVAVWLAGMAAIEASAWLTVWLRET
jgi:hypothetical protein